MSVFISFIVHHSSLFLKKRLPAWDRQPMFSCGFSGIGKNLESLVSEIRAQKKLDSLDDIKRELTHCPECPYFDYSENLCIAGNGKEPIALQTEFLFAD